MIMKRSTLFLILAAAALSVALFVVKYRVQDLDDQMRDLSRDIASTQESIHVLKSEWSHLNQPERLRHLAGRYLEVGPLDPERVGSAERILNELPERPIDETAAPELAEHTSDIKAEPVKAVQR